MIDELEIEELDTVEEFEVEDLNAESYIPLTDKPKINNVELNGNKTSSDLGLQDKIDDLATIRSGAAAGATAVQPSALNSYRTAAAQDIIDNTKVDKVNGKSLSTNDYTNEDKAKVQSALQPSALNNYYNKTQTDDLLDDKVSKETGKGLSSNDYTNADKTKVQSAIDKFANDLVNYYLKSQTYNKTEVDTLISAIKQFTYEVVDVLPTASASTMNKIYLVPSTTSATQNVKDEYITINNSGVYSWEAIGKTEIDLSSYYTKAQTDTLLNAKVDTTTLANYSTTSQMNTAISSHHDDTKVNVETGKGLSTNDYTDSDKALVESALQPSALDSYRTATAQDVIDLGLQTDIDNIEALIPSQATTSNKLTDVNFVNSSIATSTATFRGTSATGLTEQQFIAWADSLTHDDNDYVFWNTTDSDGNVQFKRYKYNGTQWLYEYTLNNSSFTANQWATINSGLSATDKTKLDGIESGAEVNVVDTFQIGGVEQTITDKTFDVPVMTTSTMGVAKLGTTLNCIDDVLDVKQAGPSAISARNGGFFIIPYYLNLAVKSALSDNKRINDMTDTEKQNAWGVLNIIKTTMDSVAVANAQYYLGEQSSVSFSLPSNVTHGQSVSVVFYSGATATTLSISGTMLGTIPTPQANQRIELNILYDNTNWCILSNVMGTN